MDTTTTIEPTQKQSKMTPKMQRFCREYMIDYNGTQAAIRAGYSKNSANEIAAENLAKHSIQTYISELQAKLAEKLDITTEYLTKELIENHNLARKAKKLNESNRAIELVGRLHGKFTEKIETTNKNQIIGIDFSKISMDDIAQLSNLLSRLPVKDQKLVETQK